MHLLRSLGHDNDDRRTVITGEVEAAGKEEDEDRTPTFAGWVMEMVSSGGSPLHKQTFDSPAIYTLAYGGGGAAVVRV